MESNNPDDFISAIDYFEEEDIKDNEKEKEDKKSEKEDKSISDIKKEKNHLFWHNKLEKKRIRIKTREKRISNKNQEIIATLKTVEERQAFFKSLKEEKKRLIEDINSAQNSPYKIIFDLSYENKMSKFEIRSLAVQISMCYALNKSPLKNKLNFFCTNYNNEIKKNIEAVGGLYWKCHKIEESFY
ncbi:MAG: hypothetical protein MJ252_15815 [archaeon]|nr:hypothetical protein [archaeon]